MLHLLNYLTQIQEFGHTRYNVNLLEIGIFIIEFIGLEHPWGLTRNRQPGISPPVEGYGMEPGQIYGSSRNFIFACSLPHPYTFPTKS